jgi:hypothetical protein
MHRLLVLKQKLKFLIFTWNGRQQSKGSENPESSQRLHVEPFDLEGGEHGGEEAAKCRLLIYLHISTFNNKYILLFHNMANNCTCRDWSNKHYISYKNNHTISQNKIWYGT